jgi:hypothetical protein
VLTYTLGTVTTLLGMATLWLACGTLARDVEECQMQMIAVKPVPRWLIWLGKWLGIMTLNTALLGLAGGCIYTLLWYRSLELTADQQTKLRQEVLVARASLKEPPLDFKDRADKLFQERLKELQRSLNVDERKYLRQQVEERVKAPHQLVMPGYARQWRLPAHQLKNSSAPLYVRTKFYVPQTNASVTIVGTWRFGPLEAPRLPEKIMSLAPETFHEFPIPASAIGDDGMLVINFLNRNNTPVLFLLDEGLEVLYREGGFGLNFVRGLGVILCWLGLLAAIGLAAASFLSFPVAAFFAMGLLSMVFFSGTLTSSVEEGTVMGRNHETGQADNPVVDALMLPVFKAMLSLITVVKTVSPVDFLSTGRSITWGLLAKSFGQIVVVLGGIFAAIGMVVFTRRELATAQGTS